MESRSHSPSCAVVVPQYRDCEGDDYYCFQSIRENLPDYPVFVVAPENLSLKKTNSFISTIHISRWDDKFFESTRTYNKLLKSLEFYNYFRSFDFILICQTDALVLNSNLDEWLRAGYDYIGAPWFVGGTSPRFPFEYNGVGNGGFSLRNIDSCISVLKGFKRLPLRSIRQPSFSKKLLSLIKHNIIFGYNKGIFQCKGNEDIFWGKRAGVSISNFKVPREEKAALFSFDAAPKFLFELVGGVLPFGCHQYRRFDPDFWESQRIPARFWY